MKGDDEIKIQIRVIEIFRDKVCKLKVVKKGFSIFTKSVHFNIVLFTTQVLDVHLKKL